MDEERIPRNFDASLRGMKIVVAALVMGVVAYGCIALLVAKEVDPNRQPFMGFIGLLIAAIFFVVREVATKGRVNSARRNIASGTWQMDSQSAQLFPDGATTEEQFMLVYQSRLIVRAALLEGASFFNLTAFIIAPQWWSFAIVAVFAAINLSTIPTRDGLLDWIDHQIELLNLETQTNS